MKLMLTLFSYGGIDPHTVDALFGEVAYAKEHGVKLLPGKDSAPYHAVRDDALISRSRSRALTHFVDSNADVCFMIDRDVQWEPGAVVQTADRAHEKKAMVAGLYSTRAKGRGISSRLKEEAVVVRPGADKFHEAEYLATGFLAIPRVVAEEVLRHGQAMANLLDAGHIEREWASRVGAGIEKRTLADFHGRVANAALHECLDWDPGKTFIDYFRCITIPSTMIAGRHEYLSEDWSFSWRARWANPAREQWAWTRPVLGHWGHHPYTVLDARQTLTLGR